MRAWGWGTCVRRNSGASWDAFRGPVAGLLIAAALAALTSVAFPALSGASNPYQYCNEYGYNYQYCGPTTGHLIVIKHVVKDNGGTADASDFTMTINGVTATGGNSFPGAESPGVDKEVTPGSYSVTETGPSGYTASFSADCTGTIAAG